MSLHFPASRGQGFRSGSRPLVTVRLGCTQFRWVPCGARPRGALTGFLLPGGEQEALRTVDTGRGVLSSHSPGVREGGSAFRTALDVFQRGQAA